MLAGADAVPNEPLDPVLDGALDDGVCANLKLVLRSAVLPLELSTILESCLLSAFGPDSRLDDNRWLAKNPDIEFIDPALNPSSAMSTRTAGLLIEESENDLEC